VSKEARRSIRIDARLGIFTPSASLSFAALSALIENAAIVEAAVANETSVQVGLVSAFSAFAPGAAIIEARVAIVVFSTVGAVVTERSRAGRSGNVDTDVFA